MGQVYRATGAITHIDLLLNWFAELKQLAVGK